MGKDSEQKITRREVLTTGVAALTGLAASSASLGQTSESQTRTIGKLNGRVALVTGAARGIGRAVALTLAREGADIVAIDIAEPRAMEGTLGYQLATQQDFSETEKQIKVLGRRCLALKGDVRDAEQMRQYARRAVSELGKIDIVVANAGILPRKPLAEITDKLWADTIGVNLTGVGNTFRAVVPHLVERKQGRMIAIASAHGRYGAHQRHVYTASKWGVIGLVKSLALELSEYMITVNAVSPGFVRSGMSENAETYRALVPNSPNPTFEEAAAALIKQRREQHFLPIAMLEPEDIANAVLFLASDEARYMTGAAIDVTAGENAKYTA